MEALTFRLGTLNTALVRIELFNIDLRTAVPHASARRDALVNMLAETPHDLVCLQEVYSRPQQRWLKQALADQDWIVVGCNEGALSGQRNWGLMILARRSAFQVLETRYHSFKPADWTEVLIAPKGAMAVRLRHSQQADAPEFWLVNIHTTYGGFNKAFAGTAANQLRQSQIREIGQAYGHLPAIIAGDYNCGHYVSQGAYTLLMDEYGASDLVNPHDNAIEFRTWDPSNPLHDSIATQRDQGDDHHSRIDQIFATDQFLETWLPTAPKMAWDQPVVAINAPDKTSHVPLSDHYGLELCVSAK